jgi:rare lipoprotein A (peptidoglycan hydrolase)
MPLLQTPHASLRPRACAVLIVLATIFGCAAGNAQGSTGGASSVSALGQDLVFSPYRSAGASWYGPGFYGKRTACGQTLRAVTIGVAHRDLPCGTMVKFVYHGSAVVAPVIDRGPYVKGRAWDLTVAASDALGFTGAGAGTLRYAVALSYARPSAR